MRRLFCSFVLFVANWTAAYAGTPPYLSPIAMAGTDKQLFVACGSGNCVLSVDLTNRKVSTISVPLPPSGLALSRDNSKLFVTCAGPDSEVCVIDIRRRKIVGTIPVGHTATAPVLSADGRTLYVCNQFENEVSVV